MKVKDLILKLQAIEDQEQEVYRLDHEWGPEEISDVDIIKCYAGRDDNNIEVYEGRLSIF